MKGTPNKRPSKIGAEFENILIEQVTDETDDVDVVVCKALDHAVRNGFLRRFNRQQQGELEAYVDGFTSAVLNASEDPRFSNSVQALLFLPPTAPWSNDVALQKATLPELFAALCLAELRRLRTFVTAPTVDHLKATQLLSLAWESALIAERFGEHRNAELHTGSVKALKHKYKVNKRVRIEVLLEFRQSLRVGSGIYGKWRTPMEAARALVGHITALSEDDQRRIARSGNPAETIRVWIVNRFNKTIKRRRLAVGKK